MTHRLPRPKLKMTVVRRNNKFTTKIDQVHVKYVAVMPVVCLVGFIFGCVTNARPFECV